MTEVLRPTSSAAATRPLLAERYDLIEVAGVGGMGTVWRAYDHRLDRYVAIKVLNDEHARDHTFVVNLLKEARNAAQLSHPNVVAVYDADLDDGRPYLVMEYVVGHSLHEHIARHGPLTIDQTIDVATALLAALSHAHERRILHRDIKSANVMVDRTLSMKKLADFGTAKDLRDGPANSGLIGTAPYVAPERMQRGPSVPASDLYSVSCVLYECLVGSPPFGSRGTIDVAYRHVTDPVPDLRALRPDVPQHLEATILRGLAKDPRDRFPSADEMAAALNGAKRNEPTRTLRLVRPPPVEHARTEVLQTSPPWTRLVPWTEALLAIAMARVGFTIAEQLDVERSAAPFLVMLAALVVFVLGVRQLTSHGRARRFVATLDAAIASGVERLVAAARTMARVACTRGSALATVLFKRLKHIRRPRRSLRRSIRLWSHRIRYRRRRSRARWMAVGVVVVVLVAGVIGGSRAITNDPQIPRSPRQALRLAGGVLGQPFRGLFAPSATEAAAFDPATVPSDDIDAHRAVDAPATCAASPSVGGSLRCVVWDANADELRVEDPCFATGPRSVLCLYGDTDVGRWATYETAKPHTPYRVPSAVPTSRHPWRLELADGSICNVARWAKVDPAVKLPTIGAGAVTRLSPSSWICARGWDRRPFVEPDYSGRDPETAGYLSFDGYRVDDAGHRDAVRLDHVSSERWRALVRSGDGYEGVDVVRVWF